MALLRRLYGRLHLTVNEAKSAVASAFGRKFRLRLLGGPGRVVKRRVADRTIEAFKGRIRELTPRLAGAAFGRSRNSFASSCSDGRPTSGWRKHQGSWRTLDKWIRHRLRAIQLKQWRRGVTIFRELVALGAKPNVAAQVAGNARRWWRNSGMLLNSVLTIRWADQLGLPKLA